jgi:hypothetical protein
VPARLALLPALLAVVAVLVPAAAQAAVPKTETATSGAVTATFTYDDAGDGRWTGLKIQVTRAGAVVFDAAPTADLCEEPYCAPGDPFTDHGSIRVADLDADGEPEVLVDLYSGGAHCCLVTEILRWTGSGYATVVRDFADFGYTLTPPAAAGRPATFVTGDQRFAYAFASFADSPFPPRLLTFDNGRWHDVTRQHPETLRADAAHLLKTYRQRRNGTRALGVLAAWVADEYRLGHRAKADAFLAAELRAGRLQGDRSWPRRTAYISTLQRRLKAWGYTA